VPPETLTSSAVGRPTRTDVLLVAVALTAVSTSGPLIAATAVPALAIAFWRNALASGLLLPVALATCRDELRRLDRRELRLAAVAGVMLALHFATWTPALTYTSVASATALVATQPVWAALISGRRGEPVGRAVWLGIGIAMSGAALLAAVDLQVSGEALVGDLLALAGGAFAALYMTAGSEVRRSVSTTTTRCSATRRRPAPARRVRGRAQQLSGYDGDDWLKLVGAHPRRAAARPLAVQPGAQDRRPDHRQHAHPAGDPGRGAHGRRAARQTPPLLAVRRRCCAWTGAGDGHPAGSRGTDAGTAVRVTRQLGRRCAVCGPVLRGGQ
jgi:hypothetical protein